MAWNVQLADFLMGIGKWGVIGPAVMLVCVALWLTVLSVWYSERQSEIAVEREWAERAGAFLLLGLKCREYYRVSFDLRPGLRSGSVRIQGKDIDFIWDFGEALFPDHADDYQLQRLFFGHANRLALVQLMRHLQELVVVNAWLHRRAQKHCCEFFVTAEVVPFPKVA